MFTPRGEIMELPRGACPVDFAYAVHTDIGNRCVACRVDRNLAPLVSSSCRAARRLRSSRPRIPDPIPTG